MKYIRARFKGYIGFYNGMGLEIVDIDFSKCVHNIVLILGGNGSGKSTLLNSLNIFPDSSSSFIPNKDAEKYLVLQDETNIYEIRILSASDLKGGRKTTKAYIKKNGLELNANGNVSSYKEIIFSEFDLDSNYISLSKLSNDDRGLGDKKPAERKKFASSIIENLETYNNIYKILNKKSLVYKSHLNTLHTKIQNIGIKESLEKNLNDLRIKESNLNSSIMEYNNTIVSIQAKNSIDEDEAKLIRDLSQSLERSEKELNELQISIDKFINSTKIKPKNLEPVLEENKNLLASYKAKLESTVSTWKMDSERLNTVSNSIRSLEAQLSSPDYNSDISQKYNDSNNKIKEIKNDLLSLNLLDIENGSTILENFLIFCQKFIESIEVFVDDMSPNDIEFVKSNNPDEEYSIWSNKQNSIILSINNIKDSIAQTREEMNKVSSFESRPKDCKNNECPFIRDGYKIIKSLDGEKIEDKLFTLHDEMDKLSKELTNSQNMMDYCRSMMSKRVQYDSIRKSLSEYQSTILLLDPELINNFDLKLTNMDFNFERDPRRIIDGLNLYKLLDLETETNKLLSVEYKSFEEKIQLINSSKSILENLKTERDGLVKVINDCKSTIDSYNSLISQLESNVSIQSEYMIECKKFDEKTNEYISYESRMKEFSKKSEKSAETLKQIEDYKSKIAYLSSELKPVMQGINHISGQLTLIDSYYSEYNSYKEKYDMIEVIKKYCSPTGGGIQTLFMQIYMSKTLELSNQLLAMLFNGEYRLLEFVINESEFRIPFVGNGLPVDDISSGSSSQIAIMGMIINLVLLHQASTKFNIARLDEIDGPLDTNNRLEFVNTLYNLIQLLGIGQLFLISHSIEADTSSVDIIKFKTDNSYESTILGNVIYDYNSEYEKTLK
jgi:DNA repair exonuclease SbcCD ATPase subunit